MAALLTGSVPSVLVGTGLPTPVIQSLDLGVVLPALALTAYVLWKGRAWAYLVAGVLLVKIATLGLAVLSMALVQALDGQVVPAPLPVIFRLLGLLGIALTGRYLLALGTGGRSVPADGRRSDAGAGTR